MSVSASTSAQGISTTQESRLQTEGTWHSYQGTILGLSKTQGTWKCDGYTQYPEGRVYQFSPNGDWSEKEDVAKHFPAIEPRTSEYLHLLHEALYGRDPSLPFSISNSVPRLANNVLPELGYGIHRDYLFYLLRDSLRGITVTVSLPDRALLLSRWEKIQQQYPHLPALDLEHAENTSSDLVFADAVFYKDGTLSDTNEFFHDHLFHILQKIFAMLRQNMCYLSSDGKQFTYLEFKTKAKSWYEQGKESVFKILDSLEPSEKNTEVQKTLIALLGASADSFATSCDSPFNYLDEILFLEDMIAHGLREHWKNYIIAEHDVSGEAYSKAIELLTIQIRMDRGLSDC